MDSEHKIQNGKTIREFVDNNPHDAVRHLIRIQMYAETLKSVIIEYAEKNDGIIGHGVSVSKRTRTTERLDDEKAAPILEEAGYDLYDIADIKLSEEAIFAKLGEKDGARVISELKAAGATKVSKTEYWRMQVK